MKNDARVKEPAWAKFAAIAFGVALLACVELVARLLIPATTLDKITAALQQDSVLFWRNRPNLDAEFMGVPIRANRHGFRTPQGAPRDIPEKKKGVLRIVCMGESPTFGWGVPYEDTYAARLEKTIREEMKTDVEVINAGMIGHSSHQGKLLLKNEILPLKPDIVTIPYVINDIDKYRFYRTDGRPDRALKPLGVTHVWISNIAGRSRFAEWLRNTIHYMIGRRAAMDGKPVEIFRPGELRVPPEDYRENLKEIAAIARAGGAKVVFIKFPVNLPVAEKQDAKDEAAAAKLFKEAAALEKIGDCDKAIEKLKAAAALDRARSDIHYLLGVCLRKTGKEEEAKKSFDRTFELEAHRSGRDGLAFNKIMEEAAREESIPLADAAAAIRASGGYLFISPEKDPIHPNAKGHEVIAGTIYKTLKKENMLRAN